MSSAFIITGPTGSGKTELALAVAEEIGAEIVSADSMSLYRGMDIGTAKPTPGQRQRAPHHLIDVLDPWESASVAWWRERALACQRDIEARGHRVLFVGGTPLYLKALLHGLFDGPPASPEVRERLAREARESGVAALHDRLAQVDPVAAKRIHRNDERRIIRALEVFELTGAPISSQQQQWGFPQHARRVGEVEEARRVSEGLDASPSLTRRASSGLRGVWLDLPRAELHERINRRAEQMFAAGLVEEVCRLHSLPRPPGREAAQGLGYKEVAEYIGVCGTGVPPVISGRDGRATNPASLAETIARVQTRSRQFAKRQITWFRSLPQLRPCANELTSVLNALKMG